MNDFITLMGSSEVQVRNKGDEMKNEEALQREWLDDQWEEVDRDVSEEWEEPGKLVHF